MTDNAILYKGSYIISFLSKFPGFVDDAEAWANVGLIESAETLVGATDFEIAAAAEIDFDAHFETIKQDLLRQWGYKIHSSSTTVQQAIDFEAA